MPLSVAGRRSCVAVAESEGGERSRVGETRRQRAMAVRVAWRSAEAKVKTESGRRRRVVWRGVRVRRGRAKREVGRQERERMMRRIWGERAGMEAKRVRRAEWRDKRTERAERMPVVVPTGVPARVKEAEVVSEPGGKRWRREGSEEG